MMPFFLRWKNSSPPPVDIVKKERGREERMKKERGIKGGL